MSPTRQLAAIMFTDIVGYTALMGEDEANAYQLLKRNREIQKPLIEKHNGKWLKEMGDGVLASFPAVSDAVHCAMDIQQATRIEPHHRLRIGIHLGEVIVENGDVFGDGVNIASRLESLAPPGGIYVTESVCQNIRNKKSITAEFIGEEYLKNVSHPVRIYNVEVVEMDNLNRRTEDVKSKKNEKKKVIIILALIISLSAFLFFNQYLNQSGSIAATSDFQDKDSKSLAVIPFWNDSPDPDNTYFCSGMEEEIRVHLMEIGDLRIESRQSVEKYRQNPDKDLVTIGKDLDVAYVVEGSVRKIYDDVRITVQLIDAFSGDHIWAKTYDGEYSQELLEFQARTAKEIATELDAVITPEEEQRIERLPTSIIKAYDLTLRGNYESNEFWRTFDKKHTQRGHQLLDSAIHIDPGLIEAYVTKANLFVSEGKFDSVLIYTKRSMKIDPDNSKIYALNGGSYFFQRKYELSVDNYLRAIELNPQQDPILINELGRSYGWQKNGTELAFLNFNKSYNLKQTDHHQLFFFIAINYTHTGDYENARKYFAKNISNRDHGPGSADIGLYAWSLIAQNKNDEAISFLDSICQIYDYPMQCIRFKFAAQLIKKDFDSAAQSLDKLMALGTGSVQWQFGDRRWGWWMLDNILLAYLYHETGRKEEASVLLEETQVWLENLLKEDQSYVPALHLSAIFAMRQKKEMALQYLSDAIDRGLMAGWHNLISTHPIFENLWDTPGFKFLSNQAREQKTRDRQLLNAMRDAGELDI